MTIAAVPPDRRLVKRMTSPGLKVKVIAGARPPTISMVRNLSTGGVCLEEVGQSLWRGMRVELRFMVPLDNGTTKIHLRHGTVVWIKAGLTGCAIDTIPYMAPG